MSATPVPTSEHDYVTFNDRPLSAHMRMLELVPRGSRVLDVGCSSGYLAGPLTQRGCTVVGVEMDPAAAAVARQVCESVVVGDVEDPATLPIDDGPFDVVLCGDLVEHLRNPGAFMAHAREALKPGGLLVLSTPNVANWSVRLALLAGRWDYKERGLLDRTHTHLFTRKSLVQTLRGAGYEPEVLDLTAPVPFINTPRVERLAHAIATKAPGFFAYQHLVSARAVGRA